MSNQLLAIGIVLVTVKLYMDHRKKNYDGPYNDSSSYKNISPMKHDLFKQTTLDLFPILIYGITSGDKFFDQNDIFNSIFGRISVGLVSYIIYYQLVEPYINAKIPRF